MIPDLKHFEPFANADRYAQIIVDELTDNKIHEILEFTAYTKRIRKPPRKLKNRAHDIVKMTAKSSNIRFHGREYELTFTRVCSALWTALSEEAKYKFLRAVI